MAFNINYILGNEGAKAHWSKRGFAFIIDLVILVVIYFVVSNIFLVLNSNTGEGDMEGIDPNTFLMAGTSLLVTMAIVTISSLAVIVILFGLMEGSWGGSPGKRLAGLRVEPLEEPMTLMKGIMRNSSRFGGILVGGLFGIFPLAGVVIVFVLLDLLMGLGDMPDPRMKFTDKIAGTTVVRTDIEEDLESLKYVPPPPPDFAGAEAGGVSVSSDIEEASPAASLSEDERATVTHYMEYFNLSEVRAVNLYNAGYKKRDDFKDAIAEDLVIVDKINPTIARHIISIMEAE